MFSPQALLYLSSPHALTTPSLSSAQPLTRLPISNTPDFSPIPSPHQPHQPLHILPTLTPQTQPTEALFYRYPHRHNPPSTVTRRELYQFHVSLFPSINSTARSRPENTSILIPLYPLHTTSTLHPPPQLSPKPHQKIIESKK
ncbi:hypothetical protein EX30DRAFT_131637 [Ascodesmis nigricans]|uniref:Uncharacterized protein n=1 Tax=Ascodesmis nigricans TaxID=341454 RepID=A0A4S2MN94_9PEZI|nr:hypothetical protein EX30DRAFT_131637 [Ascodesmis nigricans]